MRKTLSFLFLFVLLAANARAQVATPNNLTFVCGKSSFTMPFELVDNRVFDFSDMRHVFGSQTFDGVIGLPVFSQAVVRVDYARRLLTFTETSKFAYAGRGAAIPFELERYLPIIRGEVDDAPVRLGLDTGDRVLAIDGRGVESLRLIAARKELKDARRKSVRLTVQDNTGTHEVVVKLRDLV